MMLQEVLELFQFVFVVVFSSFLANCVNYPVLFRYVLNLSCPMSMVTRFCCFINVNYIPYWLQGK